MILVIYASGGPPISVTCWTEPNFLIEMLRTLVTDKDMLLKFFQMLNMIFSRFCDQLLYKENVKCRMQRDTCYDENLIAGSYHPMLHSNVRVLAILFILGQIT